jgi:hypothetical protein
MPSKRRPKEHASVGEIRVTQAVISAYKAYTEELRANGYTVRAADFLYPVQEALHHEPWGDYEQHDRDLDELHRLVYGPKSKRPAWRYADERRSRR